MPLDGKRKRLNETGDSVKSAKRKSRKHHNRPKLGPNSEEVILTYTRTKSSNGVRLEGEGNSLRRRNIVKKAILHKTEISKKQHSSGSRKNEPAIVTSDDGLNENIKALQSRRRRKKRKKRKDDSELDETSRLQRRTRYLLIKVKREQNLIDAYSAEGWKGQSREKIKPDKELERAKMEILNCKLGIREAIRQMDLLSSKGHIDDSAIAPDGSIHHEHIICAKCNLTEAFPDNDIILCDGTCNCAFHQQCLDPPLLSENIPPGDEGWFCRYCKGKMEILEATNAHLGTNFPMDSNWQDIFIEEALLPDTGESNMLHKEDWPSDDSEDIDYDPESGKSSSGDCVAAYESDASGGANSSSSFRSLDDDAHFLLGGTERLEMDETTDHQVLCQPRMRTTVDYIKLNDELFGKSVSFIEEISEDEEWGPSRRKRQRKESDGVSTAVILDEIQANSAEEDAPELKKKARSDKRSIFRFPHNAVEKLRSVFAENELPSRTIRQNLSVELGLEADKVNKWFKNSRYLALKARKKAGRSDSHSPQTSKDVSTASRMENDADKEVSSRDATLSCEDESPETSNGFISEKTTNLITSSEPIKQNDPSLLQDCFGDDVSLKYLKEKARKKKMDSKRRKEMLEAEEEMKKICEMKEKIEKLQKVLERVINRRPPSKAKSVIANEKSVMYVPVAELREKQR